MKVWSDSYSADVFSLKRGALMVALACAMSVTAYAGTYQPAPLSPFTTTTGQMLSTQSLKGRPMLLWLLSTWCGSCAAGLQTLARHADALQRAGLRIVVLRNYRNDGYPGMHIAEFVRKVLPDFEPPANWLMGQASHRLDENYNARHYPDIYFLIDAKGQVKAVDSAPSATYARILAFAKNPANR